MLNLELTVLTSEAIQFLTLRAGYPVLATAIVATGPGHPVPNALGAWFKLFGEVLGVTACPEGSTDFLRYSIGYRGTYFGISDTSRAREYLSTKPGQLQFG